MLTRASTTRITTQILSCNSRRSPLSRRAYSLAAWGSWIEQGPTTANNRWSSRRRMRLTGSEKRTIRSNRQAHGNNLNQHFTHDREIPAKIRLMAPLKISHRRETAQLFSDTLRVYEHITREISLLPGRNQEIWQPSQTVLCVQENMADTEEKARTETIARNFIAGYAVPPA